LLLRLAKSQNSRSGFVSGCYGEVFLKLIEKYREDEGGNLEKEIFAQDELLTEEKLNSLKVELGIKIANRELKRVLLKHLF